MARILLVEDDPDVRPLLEHILSSEGYDITVTETVTNALLLIEAQPYDLVVTDVNLPDGSGLRVADAGRTTGIRVLVITGHGLSLQPGSLAPYDYLLKPVRVPDLLAAVRERLRPAEEDGKVVDFPAPNRSN